MIAKAEYNAGCTCPLRPCPVHETPKHEAVMNQYAGTEFIALLDYDQALIGVSDDYRLCYSRQGIERLLVTRDEMTPEEAEEFVEYNISMTGNGPILIDLCV